MAGACTLQTCWDKLPTFREVANRLHDSLDKALRVEMYVAPQGSNLNGPNSSNNNNNNVANNRHKSLTSSSSVAGSMVKKSNKKRSSSSSSSSSLQAANLLSGLGRSSTPSTTPTLQFTKSSSSLMLGANSGGIGDTSMDSGGGGGGIDLESVGTNVRSPVGRLQAHQHQDLNSISNNNIGSHGSTITVGGTSGNVNEVINGGGGIDKQSTSSGEFAQNTIQYSSILSSTHTTQQQQQQQASNNINTNTSSPVKKRPIARSIGLSASTITPGKWDLLYSEESPDFCQPNERYNIKGTKGRICSESQFAPNTCETLCCGRGYKTEIREEKYTCECVFQYCCHLKCKTCTRRKVIHKCL